MEREATGIFKSVKTVCKNFFSVQKYNEESSKDLADYDKLNEFNMLSPDARAALREGVDATDKFADDFVKDKAKKVVRPKRDGVILEKTTTTTIVKPERIHDEDEIDHGERTLGPNKY